MLHMAQSEVKRKQVLLYNNISGIHCIVVADTVDIIITASVGKVKNIHK